MVTVTAVRMVPGQLVSGLNDSAKKVKEPTPDVLTLGVNPGLLVANAVPPVALVYQLTCKPAATVTDRTGTGAPIQIVGLLGAVGAATGGQLQLGELTFCTLAQVFAPVATKTTLVPSGILLTV